MSMQATGRAFLLLPLVLLVSSFSSRSESQVPSTHIPPEQIERWIAELDSDSFKVRETATAGLKRTGPAVGPAVERALTTSSSLEVQRRAESILREIKAYFDGDSAGWYWISGSLCDGQSFRANGEKIESVELRVARLNSAPTADLEVEIRDTALTNVRARGRISTKQADPTFAWRKVDLQQRGTLKPGQEYYLIFHSQHTSSKAPWIVNAIYRDIYPDGEHVGYKDDFFFRLTYADGTFLHVGPGRETRGTLPINSGAVGGEGVDGPPLFHGF